MNRLPLVLLSGTTLAVALAAGFFVGQHRSTPDMAMASASPAKPVLYWYDPMIPDQHFPKPGLSPMGMEMVPRYADDGDGTPGIRIDSSVRQSLGLRTAPVTRRRLDERVDAPATVAWDLADSVIVSARADGIVGKLYTPAPSTVVTKGQPLATLVAPAWDAALAEHDALRHTRSSDARALADASRQRLATLGLTSGDVHVVAGGVALVAPRAGVLATVDVREGQRVSAGQTLMTIDGLDRVWVEASIPQASAAQVAPGMPVEIRVDGIAEIFKGSIDTVVAQVDTDTRTRRVRVVLANPGHRIAPGMFAHVAVDIPGATALPLVPDEALVETGEQARVIVDDGAGRFHPQEVRTGRSSGGFTEIVDGLQGDERVVVSGQFLLDSEASLSGSLRRLDATPASTPEAKP